MYSPAHQGQPATSSHPFLSQFQSFVLRFSSAVFSRPGPNNRISVLSRFFHFKSIPSLNTGIFWPILVKILLFQPFFVKVFFLDLAPLFDNNYYRQNFGSVDFCRFFIDFAEKPRRNKFILAALYFMLGFTQRAFPGTFSQSGL
ncbi:MAG: hypothetical protein OEZ59_04750 [Deltaproteobacteria bacterium]|nr:hypothetical protein [Deltaproteobacteria bacterium]